MPHNLHEIPQRIAIRQILHYQRHVTDGEREAAQHECRRKRRASSRPASVSRNALRLTTRAAIDGGELLPRPIPAIKQLRVLLCHCSGPTQSHCATPIWPPRRGGGCSHSIARKRRYLAMGLHSAIGCGVAVAGLRGAHDTAQRLDRGSERRVRAIQRSPHSLLSEVNESAGTLPTGRSRSGYSTAERRARSSSRSKTPKATSSKSVGNPNRSSFR